MFKSAIASLLLLLSAWAHAEGTVKGWVRPMGYSSPLYPVAISMIDPVTGAFVPGLTTVNKEDGTYEITGVPEGDYKVFYDGFDEAEYYIDELTGNRKCDNGGCDRIKVGSVVHIGSGTTTLNVTLTDAAALSGRVTDTLGTPLPGVTIDFFNRYGEPYCCQRVTDEDGRWSRPVEILETYFAVARFAEPSDYQAQAYQGVPCSGCDTLATATPIWIHWSQPGIDFQLAKVEDVPVIERETVSAQKLSGSWYNPERDGEGFIVEVLKQTVPDAQAQTEAQGQEGQTDAMGQGNAQGQVVVVFWFTYTPDGRQAWMVGTGVLNDGVAEVDFEITDDAVFGADFDPLQLSRRSWGSLHLDFLNCNQAYAEYAGKFGSGQLNLTRLSAINGLDCADADNIEVSGNAADSGAWFNPERNGEGFIVETVGESSVLAYWFTYDTEGHQMWLLGVGDLDPAQQARIPMQKASGGRFGDAFDPASVSLEDWGDVSLQLGDCNHASYTWNAPAPYGAGGFDLVRLTSLKNVVCSPNPGSGQ